MPFIFIVLGILCFLALRFQKNEGLLLKIQKTLGVLFVLTGILTMNSPVQPGVVWEAYDARTLEAAKQAGYPVIMDFHAEWCGPCHQLDAQTYSNPQVAYALKDFVKLKVDVTDPDLPELQPVIERFAIDGVPIVLFLDKQGREIKESRINGFLPPADFLHQMASEDFKARTDFT